MILAQNWLKAAKSSWQCPFNIPMKAEERPTIQVSFRTQDPNIMIGTIRNPHQNSRLIYDPLCFQNPRIRSIYHKNAQSVRFLRPKPSILRPFNPQRLFLLVAQALQVIIKVSWSCFQANWTKLGRKLFKEACFFHLSRNVKKTTSGITDKPSCCLRETL